VFSADVDAAPVIAAGRNSQIVNQNPRDRIGVFFGGSWVRNVHGFGQSAAYRKIAADIASAARSMM
jgi:hypothetical protein